MYNLLFVDDDQWIADSMRELLDWNSLSLNPPYIAYSMEEAQALFREIPIHILISDIEMMGHSGFELIEWVRRDYPGTLVSFLTCHARFDFAQQAIKLGIFDYLLKPVREQELSALLESCVRALQHSGAPQPATDSKAYPEMIEKVIAYIHENLTNQISRESICRELFISESNLSRTFTKEVGMTLSDYIAQCRVTRAKELLRGTSLSVTEICSQVGYNYAAYFIKIFREKTGMTPNQYREQAQSGFTERV